MNTYSPPSLYRNCMSWRSTIACSTLMPALNVLSITAPLRTLRIFVRTNAPPLPGLTCWNSTTWNRLLSSSRVIPFFRSLTEICGMVLPFVRRSLNRSVERPLGRVGESERTVFGDDEEVLDPESTEADTIEARFDGHHVADLDGVVRRERVERSLVDFEADTVPGPVEVPVAVAGRVE